MNRSMPGLPVHHQLPEFTQTHAHRVSDTIQPSHPLSSPSPPAPNPSQHQGLFHYIKTCYFFFSISVVFNYISSLPNHGRSVALYFVAWINIFWGTYGSVYKLPMVYGFPCGSAGKESAYKKKKNLPTMREIWVQFLGWEDPLERWMVTHSKILAWRIPWGHKELDRTEQVSLLSWYTV